MSGPRKPDDVCGVTISEMDIVRGIIGEAMAYGMSIHGIHQQVYGENVDTLEDWQAALEADLFTLRAMGRAK